MRIQVRRKTLKKDIQGKQEREKEKGRGGHEEKKSYKTSTTKQSKINGKWKSCGRRTNGMGLEHRKGKTREKRVERKKEVIKDKRRQT